MRGKKNIHCMIRYERRERLRAHRLSKNNVGVARWRHLGTWAYLTRLMRYFVIKVTA